MALPPLLKSFQRAHTACLQLCNGSALSASGGILSGPAAFPDFSFLIVLTISSLQLSLDSLSLSTSSSDGGAGIDGVSMDDGLLNSFNTEVIYPLL